MTAPITVVDLFCGAGGFSTGAALALEDLGRTPGEDVELHAINHWGVAIETHEANHPWAEHYHSKVDDVDPATVAEPGDVELLVGGPECTHFSGARGGKPVDDQKREPAFNVLTWIQKLRPKNVLIENVKEFRNWGSIDDDTGQSTNDGAVFDVWLNGLNALGYAVEHRVLTCADYGDPTSRDRLFVVARRDASPSFPAPTHSEDQDDELEDWRPAAEIIDWSDVGESIWTRDRDNGRVRPLKYTTMRRIAEGIRRHCDDRFKPLAEALDSIGRVEPDDDVDPNDFRSVSDLRENAVPYPLAEVAAEKRDEPFLVEIPVASDVEDAVFCLRQQSGGVPSPVGDPLPTVSSKGAIGLTEVAARSLVMPKNYPQGDIHSNSLYPPEEQPFHTVTADPRAKLVTPHLCPLYQERKGQRQRTREIDRPLMTVPASKAPAGLACPFIDDFEGPAKDPEAPLATLETRDRFALCVPEAWPWGLDVKYRMLKPSELKQAQGFPPDYEIRGSSKGDVKEQIGNAVPVNTAKALCKHLLDIEEPSLSTYGGGLTEDPDAEIPEYQEVANADD